MKSIFLILSLFINTVSYANDHLEPEDSIFIGKVIGQYHSKVLNNFHEVFEREFALRALVLPSFSFEYTVGLKSIEDDFIIVGLKMEKNLWYNPQDNQVERCHKPITAQLANNLIEVWKKMLFETRYSDSDLEGTDGITYHFSMDHSGYIMAGKKWSPRLDKVGMLAEISDDLYKYCQNEKVQLDKIENNVKYLLNE